MGDKEFECDFTQKHKFINTDSNMNISNGKSSNESHTPPPSNSSKQSYTAHSNIFEILQISPKNISRES